MSCLHAYILMVLWSERADTYQAKHMKFCADDNLAGSVRMWETFGLFGICPLSWTSSGINPTVSEALSAYTQMWIHLI